MLNKLTTTEPQVIPSPVLRERSLDCAPPLSEVKVNCPYCRSEETRVVDSRASDDRTAIRRRRQCPACNQRFTTVETISLLVVKRSGVVEPFSREKVLAGVRKACQGRPVTDDALARLAQEVEQQVRASGSAAIASQEVGMAILIPLRELDEVAYLRFASVYRSFESMEDFVAEIELLRAERDVTADPSASTIDLRNPKKRP